MFREIGITTGHPLLNGQHEHRHLQKQNLEFHADSISSAYPHT